MTIPTDDIIDVVVNGNGVPAGSVTAPSLTEWHNNDLSPYETNVEEAMRVLEDAGYAFDRVGALFSSSGAGWRADPAGADGQFVIRSQVQFAF